MNVLEIVSMHDDAEKILATYGLHCVGCAYNQLETLREGADAHGLTDDDLGNLMEDLRELLESTPTRPQTLDITESAARALQDIRHQEGKDGWFLRVTSDDTGGFCMEFEENKKSEDRSFTHRNVPNLVLIAGPETLARIGGATIDHREGRFKLDLPVVAGCHTGCADDACTCNNAEKNTRQK